MKVGELVIYSESGQEFNALVLGERHITDHAGADGEPLLTIAFAKERKDAFGIPLPVHGTGQTSELVMLRLDVAHESHAYGEDQQRKYNRASYDGGRWREFGGCSEEERQDGLKFISELNGEISTLRDALAKIQKKS